MKNKYIIAFTALALTLSSCTKLNEELHGQIGDQGISAGNVPALLNASYTAMRNPFQGPWGWWSLQEFPSDEAIVPTRAGDWDDNGAWRALHLHKWAPDHSRISDTFRDLNSVSFVAHKCAEFQSNSFTSSTGKISTCLCTVFYFGWLGPGALPRAWRRCNSAFES